MSTSDTRRTSGTSKPAAESYHSRRTCQDPASSDIRVETAERKEVHPDITIAEEYLANPANHEAREKFAELCLHRLKSIASHVAWRPGLCPSFLNPNTFAEDLLSLAALKLGAKLHTLRNARSLDSWLYAIAFRAALDERNQIKRRGKTPFYWEGMERTDSEGNAVPVTDLLPKHRSDHCSPESCEEQIVQEDFVRKLLTEANDGSATDRDETRCFVRYAAGLKPHELAAERNITAAEASSLFRKGRKRLRRIVERGISVRLRRR